MKKKCFAGAQASFLRPRVLSAAPGGGKTVEYRTDQWKILLLFSYLAWEVTWHPRRLKSFRSTSESITEECTWQPFSLGSCSRASCAVLLEAALLESAIRTSSVWRRGFLLPRYAVFNVWMGSMQAGEIT